MMKLINVSVTIPIGDEFKQKITALSSRIKLNDISELASAEQQGDSSRKEEMDAQLAEAEVIYGFGLPKDAVARAPGLKWVQVISAGVDSFLDDKLRESSVILTNASGVHANPISEFVIQLMLMFVKQAPLCFQLKQEKQWQRLSMTGLRSKTVGIVGLGHIGREIARLSKTFGMIVIATRRSAKRVSSARYIDRLLPRNHLPQLLSDSDFVVLSLPLTPETNNLIGEKELRMMKPTAYLINAARGNIIDEEALIQALEENWIAGAGLDVFAIEPLPTHSKFWDLPNVILSPHASHVMPDDNTQATKIFYENLKRYLNGKRLVNIVNKKKGY
ncbi:D-2-hydroxyacid dehydrogenase [Chloroflexota bacterium]